MSDGDNGMPGWPDAVGPTVPQAPAHLDDGPALTELRYDRDAIRRGIAQLFTPGELSRFAKRFKVFTDREGSAARGAAQLVRAIDKRGQLRQLAEALAREKPEYDWPAPTLEAVAPMPAEVAPPPPSGSMRDPFAAPAPVAPAAATKPSEPPAAALGPAALGPTALGPTALHPDAPAPAASALDGKRATLIAALVFGGGLALGIGATVATLRSAPDEGAQEGKEARPRGPAALAMIATEELAGSVDYVSTTCELDDRSDNVREQLAEAFRRCAVTEIQPSRPAALPPVPTAAPAPKPAPRRPTRERSIPLRKPSSAARCLDKCHGVHQQCIEKECGPEPSVASQYADYQRCTSRCMTRYSRCRLSCR